MEIRLAKREDIESILKLQLQIYRIDKLAENAQRRFEDLINDPNCDILVAISNNQVVASGIIYYIHVPARGRPFALLEGLVVDKDKRGQGIGTSILKECVTFARNRDCYKIIFTSGNDRLEAHKLYMQLGFKKWGFEFRMDF